MGRFAEELAKLTYGRWEPPGWFREFRASQQPAIGKILEAFREVDLVVLDAPMGAGKSLIADVVSQELGGTTAYLCTSKTLQDQVADAFARAAVLKGRSNYAPTGFVGGAEWGVVTCNDCTKVAGEDDSCRWCPSVRECPYEVAKKDALRSNYAVLNTAYFLTEANGPGRFRGRGLVVCDEADRLEEQLLGYVSFEISERRMDRYGWGRPKLTVAESWVEWVDNIAPLISDEARKNARRGRGKAASHAQDLYVLREGKYLSNLRARVAALKEGLATGTWVYTGDRGQIRFQPVRAKADDLAGKYLWPLGRKWLLMTATSVSPSYLVREEVGWEQPFKVIELNSEVAPVQRKVIVKGVANVSRKGLENGGREDLLEGVRSVVAEHPSENILIHTVSYSLANEVSAGLQGVRRSVVTYTNAGGRSDALKGFIDGGGILVASSMDRGVDLPGDLCRVQIVAKVPYPNMGDRQVSGRKYSPGGNLWYNLQTIRTLMQMTGRAVRSRDDWAVTYILDSNFDRLWQEWKNMIPDWWKEGLQWK
jgi:Rad3-related DNA helicase